MCVICEFSITVKLIITLPCLSLDSPYTANQENIGQKIQFSCKPLSFFFWEELGPGINMPLMKEKKYGVNTSDLIWHKEKPSSERK